MTSVKEGLAKGTANIINEKGQMILLLKEELQKQASYIKELKAALGPFAKAANDHSENIPNYREAEAYFTLGQLRAARKVLGEKE